MKPILKALLYAFIFIMMFLFFLPKVELYYTLEKELEKQKIVLSDERIEDSGFSLHISDAKLYWNSVFGGQIEKIKLSTFLLHNSLSFENAKLNHALSSFLPGKIEYLNVRYSIINPIKVVISGNGDIGEIKGYINPFVKEIKIELNPPANMRSKYGSLLRKFKNVEGVLVYESRY